MNDKEPTFSPPIARFRWIRRLDVPILLILLAVIFWAVAESNVIGRALSVSDDAAGLIRTKEILLTFAQMFVFLAIGWSVTTLVDFNIKHRLSRLNLGEVNNLEARKRATKLDVLRRIWLIVGAIITVGMSLMVVPWARQIGVSLFASAGIAGIAIGIAARPVLSNLIAGLQIAFTQPVRIDDAVVIENEWGWIEEIGLFYVVIRIWDWRRLVIPLSYLIEHPFQNWTHKDASIIGSTFWWVDYKAPVHKMREKLKEICATTTLWDGNITNLQVVETTETSMQIRALATASSSPQAWDLRCYIREEMIMWLQAEHPEALPRHRAEMASEVGPDWVATRPAPPKPPGAPPERDPNMAEN
ncbi:MAG: mechanosensitive ion channel protein MscS [Hirschia sp.]|nr:mechanosensitive ion channel protein MscS [Hirschia sp.]MBF18081.1 mechanosensitive ion channel protein MscS [Hirschia sp.]|tara:strand:- start:2033 stop:3106 length:1074 start_codon:yes stop_codon:yes gene_type:complete